MPIEVRFGLGLSPFIQHMVYSLLRLSLVSFESIRVAYNIIPIGVRFGLGLNPNVLPMLKCSARLGLGCV